MPPGDPLVQFLEALVLHLPPRLHLVLACRRAPPLRIARLRAAGEVARISARRARHRARPTSTTSGSTTPPPRRSPEIVRATGGWPLAVQLAAEALRRAGPIDRATLVDRLLAPDAVLFDYLAEEVLAGCRRRPSASCSPSPPTCRTCRPACSASSAAPTSPPLLAPIGDAGIFLEPEPDDAGGVPGHACSAASSSAGPCRRRPTSCCAPRVDVLARRGDVEHAPRAVHRARRPGAGDRTSCSPSSGPTGSRRPTRSSAPSRVAEQAGAHPRIAELRGDLQYLRGEWDAALASYARAAALGDPATPRLARKQAVILYLRGRLDEAEAMCDAGPHRRHRPGRGVAGAGVAGGDALDPRRRRRLPAAARSGGRGAPTASGDDAALATVHTTKAMLAALRGDRRGNARSYQQALDHAERADDVVQIVRIRTNRGSHHTEEGAYHEALAELGAAIEVAELVGSETFSALAYSNRGDTYMRMGRLDDALRDLRRAQGIWERLGSELVDYALGQLGDVQALRGQRSEALSLYRQAIELAERRGDVQGLVPALIGMAARARSTTTRRRRRGGRRTGHRRRASRSGSRTPSSPPGGSSCDGATAPPPPAGPPRRCGWPTPTTTARRPPRRCCSRRRSSEPPSAADRRGGRPPVARPRQPDRRGPRRHAARRDAHRARPRDALLATAERLLFDAGAWGYLAEARRRRRRRRRTPRPSPSPRSAASASPGTGTPVEVGDWGSRKARDLVKLLVARRGAPVVRDEVAAMLWPDEPDRSARRLSVLLSTIRSVLDPDKAYPPDHYVAADHDTVWLVREHVDVDVELFLREAAEGRRLLANGDRREGGASC